MPVASTLGIVLPVGPSETLGAVADSVAAIRHHAPNAVLAIIDDHGAADMSQMLEALCDIRISSGRRGTGTAGGLFALILRAMGRLADDVDPTVFLKLDVDSLMIGHGLADAAADRFADETIGLLGAVHSTSDGSPRSPDDGERMFRYELSRSPWFKRARRRLHGLVGEATENGWRLGVHGQGGGYLLHRRTVSALRKRRLDDWPGVRRLRIGEDFLIAAAVASCGLRLVDFNVDPDPLGVRWKGLGMTPAEAVERGKTVVHSLRSDPDASEDELRRAFAALRSENGS